MREKPWYSAHFGVTTTQLTGAVLHPAAFATEDAFLAAVKTSWEETTRVLATTSLDPASQPVIKYWASNDTTKLAVLTVAMLTVAGLFYTFPFACTIVAAAWAGAYGLVIYRDARRKPAAAASSSSASGTAANAAAIAKSAKSK